MKPLDCLFVFSSVLAGCAGGLEAAPTAPAVQATVVWVKSGTEIGPLIIAARSYTTFVLNGNCTLSSTVQPPPSVHITGGHLAVKPSPGASSIFHVCNADFRLDHVVVSGTSGSTLVFADAPNCAVDDVAADVLLNLVKSTSKATGLAITNNSVGVTAGEGIYIGGTTGVTVTGNTLGDSWGECSLRTDSETDGAVVHVPQDMLITANHIGSHNAYGKQCAELRMGNGTVSGNTFSGAVRLGQSGGIHACTIELSGNSFADATGLPPGTPTNALQVIGQVSGTISGNTFQPTACGVSPIAVAGGNSIAITNNTSYGPKPLIATSSSARSYTLSGNHLLSPGPVVQPPAPVLPAPSPATRPVSPPVTQPATQPAAPALAPPPLAGKWIAVFDDEFNGAALAGIWTPHQYWTVSGPTHEGTEEFVPANATVSGGSLNLTVRKDNTYGTTYTSALVQAGGIQGKTTASAAAFMYGYAEARMWTPAGQGLWPTFWLMPEASITTGVNHDSDGEIDIMEVLGGDTSTLYGTLHHAGAQKQSILHATAPLSAGWHTYAVDWEADHITWYLDGVAYGTVTDTTMIPHELMYPIFDLCIGNTWGGPPNASTPFPSTLQVDYVRIWQH